MTPEEKAEKWVKDKVYQGRDFEKALGWETTVDIKEVESEIKQAYLAGYAEHEKELEEEYNESCRLGREFLIKAGQLKE